MDIAALGLSIDSNDATKAADNLDKFSASAKKAEDAAKKVEGAAKETGKEFRIIGNAIAAIDGPLGGVASRFSSIGSLVSKTGLRLGGLALAVTSIGLGGRELFGSFIQETSAAEDAVAQLETVIKSTGGTAGVTAAQMEALAKAIEGVTTYSDEQVISAETMLIKFRNLQGDIIPKAVRAAADLSTLMGKDLSAAAQAVGRALNDPIKGIAALTRSGISFSSSQKEMIATLVNSGQGVKAQTLILAELERQFGGSAAAARDTLGGALAALGHSWGNLFEITGKASEGVRSAIEDMNQAFKDPAVFAFAQAIGESIFGALERMLGALREVVLIAPTVAKALGVIGVTAAVAFAPGAIISFAGGLSVALTGSTEIVGGLIGAFQVFASLLAGGVVGAIQGVAGAITILTAAIAANPIGAFVVVLTAAASAMYFFGDSIKPVAGEVATLSDYFGVLWDGLAEQAASAGTFIVAALDKVTGAIATMFGSNAQNLASLFFSSLSNYAATAVNAIIGSFVALKDSLAVIMAAIKTFDVSDLGEKIKSAAAGAFGRDYLKELQDAANAAAKLRLEMERLADPASWQSQTTGPRVAPGTFDFSTEKTEYDKAIESIGKKTISLRAEAEAQDWAIGRQAAYIKQQELTETAIRSFGSVSAKHQLEILAVADAYGRASEAAAKMKLTQDIAFDSQQRGRSGAEKAVYERLRSAGLLDNGRIVDEATAALVRYDEQMKLVQSTSEEFTKTFAQGLLAGKSAAESLGNALDNLAQKLLDMAIEDLFAGLFRPAAGSGSSATSAVGGLLAGVFHQGGIVGANDNPTRSVSPAIFVNAPRYHSGGVAGLKSDEVPAILQKGERVLPRGSSATGGGIVVNISTAIDAKGAYPESIEQIRSSLSQMQSGLKSQVTEAVRDARSRAIA